MLTRITNVSVVSLVAACILREISSGDQLYRFYRFVAMPVYLPVTARNFFIILHITTQTLITYAYSRL